MTTIIGMVAGKGTPGVVIASDLTMTSGEWKDKGEVAVRSQTKSEFKKAYVDRRDRVAFALSGVVDPDYHEFVYDMIQGNVPVNRRMKEGMFPEVAKLNLNRFRGGRWDPSRTNELVLATRYNGTPRLYDVEQLGRVIEAPFVGGSGSGADHASKYLKDEGLTTPRDVDIEKAIELTTGAIGAASTDIYTGGLEGLDLIVVTPGEILDFGEQIKAEIKSARERAISNAQKATRNILKNPKLDK